MMPELRYAFAPMEGVTGKVLRELHAAYFPGVDRYCMPFMTPTDVHKLTDRQLRALDPGPLGIDRLLPQVLTRSAEDFLWFASAIAGLGYREVNLNLGCPSGTVVSKGRGAGMLRDPDALDRFLDQIFRASPIAVSVKTRIGLEEPAEFGPILQVLARYPIRELTVHPRTRREMYTGGVHLDAFAEAVRVISVPLCYNGNLFSPESVFLLRERFPSVSSVMIGRGLLADPALVTRCRGGERSRETLISFHNALCAAYLERLHPNQGALPKLKEIWAMLSLLFADDGSWKRMRKCKTWPEFYPLTQQLLYTGTLLPEADFSRQNQSDAIPRPNPESNA